MARPKVAVNSARINRLEKILEETGITQRELSRRIGISQQLVSRILNGSASLTDKTATLISREFPKYSVEWILGRADSPDSPGLSVKEGENPILDFLHRMARSIADDLKNGDDHPGKDWLDIYLDVFFNKDLPVVCYYKEKPITEAAVKED